MRYSCIPILLAGLILLVGPPARADEGPVTIHLHGGEIVKGRLLEFGQRTFRVRVGKHVLEISERDVKQVVFDRPARPKPAIVHPVPKAPGLRPKLEGIRVSVQRTHSKEPVRIVRYEVLRREGTTGAWKPIDTFELKGSLSGTEFVDVSAQWWKRYFYKVVTTAIVDPAFGPLPAAERRKESKISGPVSPERTLRIGVQAAFLEREGRPASALVTVYAWSKGKWRSTQRVLRMYHQVARGVSLQAVKRKGDALVLVVKYPHGEEEIEVKGESPLRPGDPKQDQGRRARQLLTSDQRVSVSFNRTPLPEVIDFLRDILRLNLVVSDSVDSEMRVSLKLRDVPLKRFFPVLLEHLKLHATPHAGALYLYPASDVLYSPPQLPRDLRERLGEVWTIAVNELPLATLFDLLGDRAGVNIVLSRAAQELITDNELIATLRVRDVSVADLLTLLVCTHDGGGWPGRGDAYPGLVWSVRNGVVHVQTTREAPALAIAGSILRIDWSEKNIYRAAREIVGRLGVYAIFAELSLKSTTIVTLRRPAMRAQEALDWLVARQRGLGWRTRAGQLEFIRQAHTKVDSSTQPGGSSPEDLYERMKTTTRAHDYRAFCQLLTRKSQRHVLRSMIKECYGERVQIDPDSRRVYEALAKRHDLPPPSEPKHDAKLEVTLTRHPDASLLYRDLAVFLEKTGIKFGFEEYQGDLADLRSRGDWATAKVYTGLRFVPVQLCRFDGRWYLHFPKAGFPSKNTSPAAGPTTSRDLGRAIMDARTKHDYAAYFRLLTPDLQKRELRKVLRRIGELPARLRQAAEAIRAKHRVGHDPKFMALEGIKKPAELFADCARLVQEATGKSYLVLDIDSLRVENQAKGERSRATLRESDGTVRILEFRRIDGRWYLDRDVIQGGRTPDGCLLRMRDLFARGELEELCFQLSPQGKLWMLHRLLTHPAVVGTPALKAIRKAHGLEMVNLSGGPGPLVRVIEPPLLFAQLVRLHAKVGSRALELQVLPAGKGFRRESQRGDVQEGRIRLGGPGSREIEATFRKLKAHWYLERLGKPNWLGAANPQAALHFVLRYVESRLDRKYIGMLTRTRQDEVLTWLVAKLEGPLRAKGSALLKRHGVAESGLPRTRLLTVPDRGGLYADGMSLIRSMYGLDIKNRERAMGKPVVDEAAGTARCTLLAVEDGESWFVPLVFLRVDGRWYEHTRGPRRAAGETMPLHTWQRAQRHARARDWAAFIQLFTERARRDRLVRLLSSGLGPAMVDPKTGAPNPKREQVLGKILRRHGVKVEPWELLLGKQTEEAVRSALKPVKDPAALFTELAVLIPGAEPYAARAEAGSLVAMKRDFVHLPVKLSQQRYLQVLKKIEGRWYLDQLLSLSTLRREYDEKVRLHPRRAPGFAGRGYVREHQGDRDGALSDFSRAIDLGYKGALPYIRRAGLLMQRKELDTALEDLKRAIALDPNDGEAILLRGDCCYSLGRWQEALEAYNKFVSLRPSDRVRLNRARERILELDRKLRGGN